MRNVFGTLRLLAVAIIGAAALAACGPDKDTMRFEGKLQNIRQAEFYIYSEENPAAGFDTIHISNGKFEYEKKIDRPSVLTLLYPNFSKTYIVAEPGATIKMKGDAAKIGEAEITGNEDNKRLTARRQPETRCRAVYPRQCSHAFGHGYLSASVCRIAAARPTLHRRITSNP